MNLAWLSLAACLERTTGAPSPLDPRFTAGATESSGQVVTHDPDAGATSPFGVVAEDGIVVRGNMTSPMEGAIALDILTIDPTSEAGVSMVGRVLFPEGGAFELDVPKNQGELTLQFFVDQGRPGPDDADPFVTRTILVETKDLDLGELTLEIGGRAVAPLAGARSHVWPDHPGPWTRVQGTVLAEGDSSVAVDIRKPDPNSQTGDAFVGKEQLSAPGPFTLMVPQGMGELTLQFFQDAGGDGPSADDPFAEQTIAVEDQERLSLEVRLLPAALETQE